MSDNVLREFLVSLGFKIDEVGMKKFTTSVEGITKTVLKLGAEVAAAATGVVAGVKIISSQMENLYYASQRTGATVGNIMALRYAASQIGITADQAQGALENFARTLRLNPGSSSLLDSLGVTGKDPSGKLDSFIGKMKDMQPYVAAAYAQLFGIDPDTLLMLEQGQQKRLDSERKYREKLAAFGIDPDQAAEAGKDFNNSIRDVKDTFNDLWIVIESRLAPVLTPLVDEFEKFAENHAGEVAQGIADAVQQLANWIQSVNWKKVGDDIDTVYHAIGGLKGVLIALAAIQLMPLVTGILNLAAAVTRLGTAAAGGAIGGLLKVLGPIALMFHSEDLNQGEDEYLKQRQEAAAGIDPSTFDFNGPANRGGKAPSSPSATSQSDSASTPGDLFASLEKKFGLAPGTLDKIWNIESGRGRKMLSAAGAKGHFQFMDDTARQYGVSDPNDLIQSARGAAEFLHDLLARYAGDMRKALAAYNWGSGNLDKDIARHGADWANFLPNETAGYLRKFDGTRLGAGGRPSPNVNIQQDYTFHIDGSADPQGTARAIGGEQGRVNGDLVRNFAGAFR